MFNIIKDLAVNKRNIKLFLKKVKKYKKKFLELTVILYKCNTISLLLIKPYYKVLINSQVISKVYK